MNISHSTKFLFFPFRQWNVEHLTLANATISILNTLENFIISQYAKYLTVYQGRKAYLRKLFFSFTFLLQFVFSFILLSFFSSFFFYKIVLLSKYYLWCSAVRTIFYLLLFDIIHCRLYIHRHPFQLIPLAWNEMM